MNITSASNSPRAQVERLLSDVKKLHANVDGITSGYADCFHSAQDAGRSLQSTQSPLRRAQMDNAQTDVSWEGRQIEQHVGQAERGLQNNGFKLRHLEGDAGNANREFTTAQQNMQQVLADSTAYPSALTVLQQASRNLNAASNDHGSANGEARWAQTKGSDAEREIRWSDMYVRNISYDRPGTDVSADARQAASRLDSAQWHVRDHDRNLRQANGYEARSGQSLLQVEANLQEALRQLPA
jgi:hypothetical protein